MALSKVGGNQIDTVSGTLSIDSGSDNVNTLLLSDGAADSNIVDGFVTCRHHSSSEQPVHMIQGRSTSSENIVLIGGTHNNTTYNTATSIKFFTAADYTTTTPVQRMTINSSGNVGIGTTNGDMASDGNANRTYVAINGSGNRGVLNLGTSSSAGADVATIGFNNGSDYVGSISVDSASGSTNNGTITVTAGSVNQMSIDSGSIGINQSAGGASGRLHVLEPNNRHAGFFLNSNASFSSSTLQVSTSRNTTNSSYNHLRCSINGVANKMVVRDSGNVANSNNSYGSISDQRMKENIVDAASQWDDIKALQIRKYNRIGETQKELGVIAQELEASGMGGLVEEGSWYDVANNPNEETRKSVKYSILYMKAVKALQEAMTRIEALEARITSLEAG